MGGFEGDSSHEVFGRRTIRKTAVLERLRHQPHCRDRCAQLVRDIADEVTADALQTAKARLVAHRHDRGHAIVVDGKRPHHELTVRDVDVALLEATGTARSLGHAQHAIVDLGRMERIALCDRHPEQLAGRARREQHSIVAIQDDEALVGDGGQAPEKADHRLRPVHLDHAVEYMQPRGDPFLTSR